MQMRLSMVILGLVSAGLGATTFAVGCGSSDTTTSGTTGGPGASTGSAGAPCQPSDPKCEANAAMVTSDCLAITDNKGLMKFGLRMSQLSLTKPAALATGVVNTTVGNNVLPKEPNCYLMGSGNFSWIL